MKIVIFGLTISSSWGNGHATLWRGLVGALAMRGCEIVFFERDVPYYAENRDFFDIPGGSLVLYGAWDDIRTRAAAEVAAADVAIVTSYCPDGLAASALVCEAARALPVFYDLDTPVTLSRLEAGESVPYIGEDGLSGFELVLSYTGGRALDALQSRLGAKRVAPLYGHVDPDVHRPADPDPRYACDLSYLGTYSADRQAAVETLFIAPARRRPQSRFLLGGSLYPQDFPWTDNIYFVHHVPPGAHPAFFSSSRMTLNVTRAAMAQMGWCPSGRLFEAAACGTPILSDNWEGLDSFLEPGREILVAETCEDAVEALDMTDNALARLARRARERVLAEHSSATRAETLVRLLEDARAAPAARLVGAE
jgi:spore maturation protein CgeB